MNMEKIIVYGSQYGTTKRYAEKFSEITHLPCISYEEVKTLSGYDLVIHFGGVMGSVLGGVGDILKTNPLYRKILDVGQINAANRPIISTVG